MFLAVSRIPQPTLHAAADICIEWASGDKAAVVEWETGAGDGLLYHKFWRQNQDIFQEAGDQASWGNWWWAVNDAVSLSQKGIPGILSLTYDYRKVLPSKLARIQR
jgi:hypothetical protein